MKHFSLDDEIHLPEPSKSSRIWSPFQEAVFEGVKNPSLPILIQAVAGSGKSTTLEAAVGFAPGSTLIMAFNKSIAEEMKSRVYCDVKTLNALGWKLLKDHIPSSQLNAKKISELLKMMLPSEEFTEYGFTLDKIISLAKNNAFGIAPLQPEGIYHDEDRAVFPVEPAEFFSLLDAASDIPEELLEKYADICSRVLFQAMSDLTTHDFNDQLYLPLLKGWRYPRYNNIFIDECQDLSPIQHLMLEALQSEGGRVVAVGDRHQSIYGFRGALTHSMDILKSTFQMTEFPLSISYRCSQAVVVEAKKLCPHIQFREGAPLGSVLHNPGYEDPQLFSSKQLIICRNNAPLFRAILRSVRAKEPCRVLSNFLESFSSFIRHFKAKETKDLKTKLDRWYEKEVAAASKRKFGGKIAGLTDKYETLSLFCEEFKKVDDILSLLKELSSGSRGPTFATIHKAKGLEAESVYFLRPDLLPSKWATGEDSLQQESNLKYVGITRAKEELVFGVEQ